MFEKYVDLQSQEVYLDKTISTMLQVGVARGDIEQVIVQKNSRMINLHLFDDFQP